MTLVWGVPVAIVEVVDMVAMDHRLVTAARTMLMIAVLDVFRVARLALVPVALVLAMDVAVMEVIHVIAVRHRRVFAVWRVRVGVIGMRTTSAHASLLVKSR
jgi:hypothetical protein